MTILPVTSPVRFIFWPAFFFFGATAVLWGSGAPIGNAVAAALLLCAGAIPIMAFLRPGRVCGDLPLFVATVAVGLVLIGGISTLGRALAVRPELAIAAYLIVGLAGAFRHLRSHEPSAEPAFESASRIPSPALRIAAVAMALILSSVVMVYSVRMGAGPYPAVFYGVDNAYLLSIVRSLAADNIFPPKSLTFVGQMGAYHYAMLDAGAMMARISGLAPHAAFFLAGLGSLALGSVALCWLIARTVSDGWLRIAIMAMLYIGTFYQSSLRPVTKVGRALYLLLTGNTAHQLPLSLGVGHVITQAGMLLALFVVYLTLSQPLRRRSIPIAALLGLVVGAAAIVKVQHFIALCLWLGAVGVIGFVQERPWRTSWREMSKSAWHHFWPAAAGFVIGFLAMHIEGFAGSGRKLTFALFANDYVNENLGETFRHAGFLFVPAVISLLLAKGRGVKQGAVIAAAFALFPLGLVAVTALTTPDGEGTDFNWFQVTAPATIGLALCAGLLVAGPWRYLSLAGRCVVALAIVAAIGTQTLRFPLMAADTVLHRDHGQEVMDNGAIAPALQAIPTEASVLVTNDLRSPAENYKRPDRQTQIPGIFGHQCFLITPAYDQGLPDLAQKKAAQQLLQLPKWQPRIAEAAKRNGWTHFLVHKDMPYPSDMPLEKIYDSATYAVYRF